MHCRSVDLGGVNVGGSGSDNNVDKEANGKRVGENIEP